MKNQGYDGAAAMANRPRTETTDPAVMMTRGPYRSSRLPSTTPTIPETTWLTENAAVSSTAVHPVSSTIEDDSTANV